MYISSPQFFSALYTITSNCLIYIFLLVHLGFNNTQMNSPPSSVLPALLVSLKDSMIHPVVQTGIQSVNLGIFSSFALDSPLPCASPTVKSSDLDLPAAAPPTVPSTPSATSLQDSSDSGVLPRNTLPAGFQPLPCLPPSHPHTAAQIIFLKLKPSIFSPYLKCLGVFRALLRRIQTQ